MRISDWSSDVCSSDLSLFALSKASNLLLSIGDMCSLQDGTAEGKRHERQGRKRRGVRAGHSMPEQPFAGRPGLRTHRAASLIHSSTGRVHEFWPAYDRSEEHTSELQSLMRISYAVFCLQQNNKK